VKSPPQAFLAKNKWDWYEFTAFPHTSFEIPWKLLLVKFKVKVGTRGIWLCHFVPYLQGQHQATGAGLKEFPCFFFFFSEKDDTKNRSTTLAERFSTSPSTSKSPVPQLHLLVLHLISSTPHSQPSPSLRAGDGKRNVPLTLTVVQFHWKLTEAVDTPGNSDVCVCVCVCVCACWCVCVSVGVSLCVCVSLCT